MNLVTKIQKLIRIAKYGDTLHALMQGSAAGVEHERILRTLNKCGCVVDVGANRGQFALISRKVWPNANIYSFEPVEEPAHIFRTIFKKDVRIHLYPCAIGAEKGQSLIHIAGHDDSSSLLPISFQQSALFPGTEEKETRTIAVCPLDDILEQDNITRPAILKIDVQGYELFTLRGCEQLLECFDYIYVECSFIELYEGQALAHQVIDYLHLQGFYLSGVYHVYYDEFGRAIQGDFLFQKLAPR